MKENKEEELWREKLSGLESYQTSSGLDHQIAEALDRLAWHTQLEKSLPTHAAPDTWPQIDKALRAPQVPNRILVLKRVAVALIVLGGIFFFLRFHHLTKKDTLIHYEVEGEEIALGWEGQQWMYFDEFCAEHQVSCDLLHLEDLRMDWDATVKALHDLKEAMGLYGKEEHLLDELNRLEAEYATLVNRFLNALLS